MKVCHIYHSCTLRDYEALPSARALGKGPSRTRQRLCRAPTRQRPLGKELIGKGILCRVPRVRHSTKPLPSATSALGKDKKEKTPKNRKKFFLGGGLPSASTSPLFFNVFPTKISTLPQPRFKPRNLSHKHITPYPLHYTIMCVYISFWFFIYYTKSHVN